jgi:hypothetical protein
VSVVDKIVSWELPHLIPCWISFSELQHLGGLVIPEWLMDVSDALDGLWNWVEVELLRFSVFSQASWWQVLIQQPQVLLLLSFLRQYRSRSNIWNRIHDSFDLSYHMNFLHFHRYFCQYILFSSSDIAS